MYASHLISVHHMIMYSPPPWVKSRWLYTWLYKYCLNQIRLYLPCYKTNYPLYLHFIGFLINVCITCDISASHDNVSSPVGKIKVTIHGHVWVSDFGNCHAKLEWSLKSDHSDLNVRQWVSVNSLVISPINGFMWLMCL